MRRTKIKIKDLQRKLNRLVFISVFFFLTIATASLSLSPHEEVVNSNLDTPFITEQPLKTSELFENDILYIGDQDALTINETAIYSSTEHFTIGNGTNPLYTSQNAEYPIDTTHDWEGYYYNATISNIQDERDWVENGGLGTDYGLYASSRIYQIEDSGPNYNQNSNPNNILATFDGNDCDFMRLHFVNLTIEYWSIVDEADVFLAKLPCL